MVRSTLILMMAAFAAAAGAAYVYEGGWGSAGSGNGEFNNPGGIALSPGRNVYVADYHNDRVQYFTSAGSFLGKWGSEGSGPGQFLYPFRPAVSPEGRRVYVTDLLNCRVQYFRWSGPAVSPTSLGRVKAVFK